jgi:hypothetical protein
MTRVRRLARLRAAVAVLGVTLLTLSAAGAVIVVTGESAAAAGEVTITSPASGGVFTNAVTFSGTGNAGDTVTLSPTDLASGPCVTGVVVQSNSSWTCDAVFTSPDSVTVTATQTGVVNSSTFIDLDIALTLTSDVTSPGVFLTNNPSGLDITGTGSADTNPIHGTFSNGTTTVLCDGFGLPGGNWDCSTATGLADGDYAFTAIQVVGETDSLASAPITYRVDTTHPDTPKFVTPFDAANPPPQNVVTTTDSTPTMSGTFVSSGVPEANATVEVDFGDATFPDYSSAFGGTFCVTTTDASGDWSCTGPSSVPEFNYGGFYGISIVGTDQAGNAQQLSPDPTFGLKVNTPPPVPQATTVVFGQPIIELDGTGVAGGMINGTVSNGQTCSAMVTSGQYECDFTLTPATDGDYTVDLTQSVDGITSTPVTVTVRLDQTAPTDWPDFFSPWTVESPGPAQYVTTNGAQNFQGGAEPNAHVFVYAAPDADGYPANVTPDGPVCNAFADGSGFWTCTAGPDPIPAGTYSIGVMQYDEANNPGPSPVATFELIVDAAPATPTIATPAAGKGSNLRNGDPVIFSGSGGNGTTVKIYEGETVLCQSPVSAGSWSCTIPTLSDGSHTIAALAVDHYGISSDAISRTFTVLPKAIGKTPLTFTIGVTDGDGNPLDGTTLTPGEAIILWSMGLPPGSTVSAELHSTPYPLGSATVGDDGSFKLKTSIPLDVESGDHEFSVTVTPPGDDATTITSHTSVAPVVVAPSDDATPQPLAAGAGAPPIGQRPADGFDSPSTFASTLPAFGSFPVTPTTVAVTGGIALAFLLLVAFPSELLEDTVRENYDRAFGWLVPVRRRIDHARGRFGGLLRNPWAGIALSVAATAVILGFADPTFGFTGASVRLLIGMIISVAIINIGISLLVMRVARREYGDTGYLRPMPGALVIVALSVIVSRLADISPGFLFGVVMGVAYARELKIAQEAKLAVLGAVFTIAAGILAWLGFSALRGTHGSGFWYQLGLETLVAITLEAIGTMIIAMLPLTFLDGKTIFRWNRWAWAGLYLVTVVVFAVVVLPISNNWGAMTAPIFGWGTLFVVFAIVAFGTWAVFRFIPRRGAATTSSPEAEEEPQPQLRR